MFQLMNNVKYSADGKVNNNAYIAKVNKQVLYCVITPLNLLKAVNVE